MRRLLLAAALSAALVAAPAALGARRYGLDVLPQHSSNWAGYAVSDATTLETGTADPTEPPPLQFTSVTATWKIPKVVCASEVSPSYSAFWVGLGGYSDGAESLEQIGIDADCSRTGKPVYYAWYELVPAPPVRIALKVAGGETISASVNIADTDVLVQVKDRSRATSFTRHLTMASPDLGSAEWIAEAPSSCTPLGDCRVLPLANFGKVGFTRIATIANAHPGTLADQTWSAAAITLVPHLSRGASEAGAKPDGPTPDGRSFSVGWLPNAERLEK